MFKEKMLESPVSFIIIITIVVVIFLLCPKAQKQRQLPSVLGVLSLTGGGEAESIRAEPCCLPEDAHLCHSHQEEVFRADPTCGFQDPMLLLR